jgi:hypothetical protein
VLAELLGFGYVQMLFVCSKNGRCFEQAVELCSCR